MAAADRATQAAQRLRLALDLYEAGEQVMRASLRRRHPGASETELESMLLRWLAERPGAEHGDCAGRARAWPER